MQNRRWAQRVVYILLVVAVGILAEGCLLGKKKCGCGSDINNNYRPNKRYR